MAPRNPYRSIRIRMKQYCQVMQNRGITNLVYADQTRIRCAHTHLYVYGHTESLLKFDSRYLTWNSPANPMNHLTLKLTAKADNVLTNYFSEKKKTDNNCQFCEGRCFDVFFDSYSSKWDFFRVLQRRVLGE